MHPLRLARAKAAEILGRLARRFPIETHWVMLGKPVPVKERHWGPVPKTGSEELRCRKSG